MLRQVYRTLYKFAHENYTGMKRDWAARKLAAGWSAAVQRLEGNSPTRPHGLPAPLIVSLTSYPPRFPTLYNTLVCLLTQDVKPDRVILWIARQDIGALPDQVRALERRGLEIREAEDTGPFKKIIPLLAEQQACFVVTADDDVFYWPDWLRGLVQGWTGHEKEIVFYRGHKIRFEKPNYPLPYMSWVQRIWRPQSGRDLFPTGAGGVLYPPHIFKWPEVLNSEKFLALCPRADDVWLYWMARQNGSTYRKVGLVREVLNWDNTQDVALWHENAEGNINDIRIKAMIGAYGWPGK